MLCHDHHAADTMSWTPCPEHHLQPLCHGYHPTGTNCHNFGEQILQHCVHEGAGVDTACSWSEQPQTEQQPDVHNACTAFASLGATVLARASVHPNLWSQAGICAHAHEQACPYTCANAAAEPCRHADACKSKNNARERTREPRPSIRMYAYRQAEHGMKTETHLEKRRKGEGQKSGGI
eukprot:6211518-Pleurochrysis_carterae.AAC.2